MILLLGLTLLAIGLTIAYSSDYSTSELVDNLGMVSAILGFIMLCYGLFTL